MASYNSRQSFFCTKEPESWDLVKCLDLAPAPEGSKGGYTRAVKNGHKDEQMHLLIPRSSPVSAPAATPELCSVSSSCSDGHSTECTTQATTPASSSPASSSSIPSSADSNEVSYLYLELPPPPPTTPVSGPNSSAGSTDNSNESNSTVGNGTAAPELANSLAAEPKKKNSSKRRRRLNKAKKAQQALEKAVEVAEVKGNGTFRFNPEAPVFKFNPEAPPFQPASHPSAFHPMKVAPDAPPFNPAAYPYHGMKLEEVVVAKMEIKAPEPEIKEEIKDENKDNNEDNKEEKAATQEQKPPGLMARHMMCRGDHAAYIACTSCYYQLMAKK